jgi:hypothetical protein
MSYCHLTSAGTELKFHPRVATFLQNRFNSNSITPCATTASLPTVNVGADRIVCSGSSASIGGIGSGGSGTLTYSWRPATGLSSTNTAIVNATPAKTTTYIVTVTDANTSLRTYDTVKLTVQKPGATISGVSTVCQSSVYKLNGTATGIAPFTYQWTDTATDQVVGTKAQVDVTITKKTTFKLLVTDSVGCTNSVLKTISIYPAPTVPVISVIGDSLFSTTASAYQWLLESVVIPGAASQKYVPAKSGNYTVRTTNATGCDTISTPFAFTLKSGVAVNFIPLSMVRLYPNPASGQITFDYRGAGDVPLELTVSDILGNTVYHSSRKAEENYSPLSIDIRSFAQGTYYVRYSFGGAFSTLKFIKE